MFVLSHASSRYRSISMHNVKHCFGIYVLTQATYFVRLSMAILVLLRFAADAENVTARLEDERVIEEDEHNKQAKIKNI